MSSCRGVPCRGHLLRPAARSRGHALPLVQCSRQRPGGHTERGRLSQHAHWSVCLSRPRCLVQTCADESSPAGSAVGSAPRRCPLLLGQVARVQRPALSGRGRPVCGRLCGRVGVQRCPGRWGAIQGSLLTVQEDLREAVWSGIVVGSVAGFPRRHMVSVEKAQHLPSSWCHHGFCLGTRNLKNDIGSQDRPEGSQMKRFLIGPGWASTNVALLHPSAGQDS